MQGAFLMVLVILECLFRHSLETTTPVEFAIERLKGNRRFAETIFNKGKK